MNVVVRALDGNRSGGCIVDSLLVSEASCVERATQEIYDEAYDVKVISGGGPKNDFMETTEVAEIQSDSDRIKGYVKSYTRTYNSDSGGFKIDTAIRLETPIEYVSPV